MTFVSVIIPTIKGREKLLERAIKSVESQTHSEIEYIVSREGINAAEARNIAAQKAKGEYLAFLDDDDIFLPNKIKTQSQFLDANPTVGLVACWIDDKRFDKQYIDKYPLNITKQQLLKMLRFSSTSSYMIRKSLFNKVGGFDESLPSAQEYDLALRCADYMNISCVQEVLVQQNKSQNQITKDAKKKVLGLKMIYDKHYKQSKYKKYIPISVPIKFKMAITLYKLYPYFGKTIEKLVVIYKTLL